MKISTLIFGLLFAFTSLFGQKTSNKFFSSKDFQCSKTDFSFIDSIAFWNYSLSLFDRSKHKDSDSLSRERSDSGLIIKRQNVIFNNKTLISFGAGVTEC